MNRGIGVHLFGFQNDARESGALQSIV